MRNAQDLLDELNEVDESTRIEAKRASDVGKAIMETVIAFANEPGLDGGYLLLGVDWVTNEKGDTIYTPAGLPEPDKVQRDLASQCVTMLNIALRPEMKLEQLEGKTVLVVYVPEVDVSYKPVYKKATGLPRGAYRRIGTSDQRCVDEDLWVLRGSNQLVHGPDSSVFPDATIEDLDPAAIEAYRRERRHINSHAEELSYSDEEMLEALGALKRVDGSLLPTLAGILLFGKPMSLRRVLPMAKIDYIRVPGLEWMEDPHERFQSIEIRKPLLLALPQVEASIVDDLPKGFYLPEGQLQSIQEPIVPRKVVREALANAVMHRTYTKHSPTQIIRYSNRIEIRNVGYSLKPVNQLGSPGSWPRNPVIAAVLHDLNLAEAKGTGIRSMRKLAAEAGVTLPEFHSDREGDSFCVTIFLHNLINEDDHVWLRTLTTESLDEEERKVLIYARATGAVDNTACRDFSGMDTLAASRVLRRLRDKGLLSKQGAGNRTYYTLNQSLTVEDGSQSIDDELATFPPELATFPPELATFPPELATLLATLQGRSKAQSLRDGIKQLCAWQPMTVEQLATLLNKSRDYLRNKHLIPMVEQGQLRFLYPESANHPHQAYVSVDKE